MLKQLQESWSGVGKGNLRGTEIQVLWKAGVALEPACLPASLPEGSGGGVFRAAWCDGQKLAFGSPDPGRVTSRLLICPCFFTQSGNANSQRRLCELFHP